MFSILIFHLLALTNRKNWVTEKIIIKVLIILQSTVHDRSTEISICDGAEMQALIPLKNPNPKNWYTQLDEISLFRSGNQTHSFTDSHICRHILSAKMNIDIRKWPKYFITFDLTLLSSYLEIFKKYNLHFLQKRVQSCFFTGKFGITIFNFNVKYDGLSLIVQSVKFPSPKVYPLFLYHKMKHYYLWKGILCFYSQTNNPEEFSISPAKFYLF